MTITLRAPAKTTFPSVYDSKLGQVFRLNNRDVYLRVANGLVNLSSDAFGFVRFYPIAERPYHNGGRFTLPDGVAGYITEMLNDGQSLSFTVR